MISMIYDIKEWRLGMKSITQKANRRGRCIVNVNCISGWFSIHNTEIQVRAMQANFLRSTPSYLKPIINFHSPRCPLSVAPSHNRQYFFLSFSFLLTLSCFSTSLSFSFFMQNRERTASPKRCHLHHWYLGNGSNLDAVNIFLLLALIYLMQPTCSPVCSSLDHHEWICARTCVYIEPIRWFLDFDQRTAFTLNLLYDRHFSRTFRDIIQ